MSQENPKNQSDQNDNWHKEILEGIHPKDERALMFETRQRAKRIYGFTDEQLDKAYGVGSRRK